ncbi:MAG: CDGSH iron-sulfur domain-containing protein [Phycisphaeraceae bacterium]|nr:CDGSH iron-sulfur domain-containing protein [Phycisphaeraceae bacterium]
MARIVRVTGNGPIKIEPQTKPIFVCGCGLSHNLPFCDGHHKKCREELPGKLYRYDERGEEVVEVVDDPKGG